MAANDFARIRQHRRLTGIVIPHTLLAGRCISMWIDIAKTIVSVFGPCPIVQWRAEGPALMQELLLAGCDAHAVGEVEIAHPCWISPHSARPVPRTSHAVMDVDASSVTLSLLQALLARDDLHGLALLADGANDLRQPLEHIVFARGWRRHPAGMPHGAYESLSDTSLPRLSFYQRIPAAAAARWPVTALARERNLHMDMLRESGCRADAHIARYALAASLVRPGDTVLDCACGLGYGTAVVATLSRARAVIGIDCDADTVAYAEAHYGGPDVSFQTGDAAALSGIADASVDVVVAMETLEHVADWTATTREFARILKPDGRLIASVPDRWMDDTGEDPNPYHFHVFDWDRLRDGLHDDFVIERRYAQAAPGGFKLTSAARMLQPVPFGSSIDAEWILVVASANPFARVASLRDGYVHPEFGAALVASAAALVDYRSGYDNPWLYRTLVQMGERMADDVLGRLAEWAADNSRPGSADQGAALCVAGYRALEQRADAAAIAVIAKIDAYHRLTGDTGIIAANPHVQRWRVSSAYLAGRLCELAGARDDALTWFTAAGRLDWRSFSPLLATKTIAGAFHAARLCLVRGDQTAATDFFRSGVTTALDAARGDHCDIIGAIETPIPFGLTELAEVMDMGSQCALALARLPLWRRAPAAFWQQIDMRRFGLASWARDVEAENARLRAAR